MARITLPKHEEDSFLYAERHRAALWHRRGIWQMECHEKQKRFDRHRLFTMLWAGERRWTL